MECRMIIKVVETGQEIALPVTPKTFRVSKGQRVETVHIHQAGDAVFSGYAALATVTVDAILPARDYPFASREYDDPYEYVRIFKGIVDKGQRVRYIVTGTDVNLLCLLEEVAYGEQDGTGDVYAVLRLRECRQLQAVRVDDGDTGEAPGNTAQPEEDPPDMPDTHTVVRGDTLGRICRKYYGDSGFYPQLAEYNNIPNPNLIYDGDVLKIPPKATLEAMR